MSGTLVWTLPVKATTRTLPLGLKWVLQRRFNFPLLFNLKDLDYIQGLIDCEIKGAQELYDLIVEHEEVSLSIEY